MADRGRRGGTAIPTTSRLGRGLALATLLLAAVALVVLAERQGRLAWVTDEAALRAMVARLGPAGPLAIVLLLALAIVASPIPSAPIGLAAGALYGVAWGTALTVAGSCLGATVAFAVARYLAFDAVRRWDAVRRPLDWLDRDRSQAWLMGVVFATRLAPFLSFDAISYAAGLTRLSFWRFLVATLAGVAPISLLLAYGGEAALAAGGIDPILSVLVLGGITGIPILARLLWVRLRRGRGGPAGPAP